MKRCGNYVEPLHRLILDSLVNAGHPDADPETGAVHCCGHSVR